MKRVTLALALAALIVQHGTARVAALQVPGYKARVERAIVIHVEAFDWNCPQHITPRYTMDEIRSMTLPLREHVENLEKEVAQLRAKEKAK